MAARVWLRPHSALGLITLVLLMVVKLGWTEVTDMAKVSNSYSSSERAQAVGLELPQQIRVMYNHPNAGGQGGCNIVAAETGLSLVVAVHSCDPFHSLYSYVAAVVASLLSDFTGILLLILVHNGTGIRILVLIVRTSKTRMNS